MKRRKATNAEVCWVKLTPMPFKAESKRSQAKNEQKILDFKKKIIFAAAALI